MGVTLLSQTIHLRNLKLPQQELSLHHRRHRVSSSKTYFRYDSVILHHHPVALELFSEDLFSL